MLDYIPPHPQEGTPYHRYTFLLFAQSPSTPLSPITLNLSSSLPSSSSTTGDGFVADSAERRGLNVREFVETNGLVCEGVTFFRQVWTLEVRAIYKEILGKHLSFCVFFRRCFHCPLLIRVLTLAPFDLTMQGSRSPSLGMLHEPSSTLMNTERSHKSIDYNDAIYVFRCIARHSGRHSARHFACRSARRDYSTV